MGDNLSLVICDEWMFFNPGVLPAIIPTLATGAIFIIISSVAPDGDSPLRKVIDALYPDGTRVIKLLDWVQVCPSCERRGLADTCTHLTRPPQHFHTYGGQAKMSALLAQNEGAYEREFENKSDKPLMTAAFEREWIDYMVNNRYDSVTAVKYLFISIDPAACKDLNCYVLTSMFFINGICVVLGGETINKSNSLVVSKVVTDHIRRCRKLAFLRGALAVIIPEANMPTTAMGLLNAMRENFDVPNAMFMTEDNNRGSQAHRDLPGTITTRENKPEMVELLIEEYFKKRRVVFHRHFIVENYEWASVDDVQAEFIKQLRNFQRKRKQCTARDGTGYLETFYTGKIGGQNDDFVMALLIGIYYHRQFFTNLKYRQYWKR